jgi:hypothetical protein
MGDTAFIPGRYSSGYLVKWTWLLAMAHFNKDQFNIWFPAVVVGLFGSLVASCVWKHCGLCCCRRRRCGESSGGGSPSLVHASSASITTPQEDRRITITPRAPSEREVSHQGYNGTYTHTKEYKAEVQSTGYTRSEHKIEMHGRTQSNTEYRCSYLETRTIYK